MALTPSQKRAFAIVVGAFFVSQIAMMMVRTIGPRLRTPRPEELMSQVILEAHRKCPLKIDSETILNSIGPEKGLKLVYNYTLPNVDLDQFKKVDAHQQEVIWKQSMVQKLKSSDQFKPLMKAGISFDHVVNTSDGYTVLVIHILPSDYQ